MTNFTIKTQIMTEAHGQLVTSEVNYEENYYRLKLKNHVLSMQNSVGLLLGIHRFKQKYLEKFRPRPNNTNIIRNFGC